MLWVHGVRVVPHQSRAVRQNTLGFPLSVSLHSSMVASFYLAAPRFHDEVYREVDRGAFGNVFSA